MSEIKVKTFKFKGKESIELSALFKMFFENRTAESLARKNKEAAAVMLHKKLKEFKDIDLNQLPEGDSAEILCEKLHARIDREGRDLFDLESFRAEFPEESIQFTKRNVSSRIKLINS